MVALITAILIALFLFSAGALLAVQGNTSIFSGQFESQSDKAEALAQAGIQDATIKIDRNNTTNESYTITETDGTVAVAIVPGTPVIVNATGTVTITKDSVSRAVQAQITLDANGTITSITETDK